MESFPHSARGRRPGKLTAVLDHQLRVGDQAVSEDIIAAYAERGIEPPEHLVDPPKVKAEYFVYWEAFQDLISERRSPRGPIPTLAIIEYADAYGLDREILKRVVWAVDKILTEHWKATDSADEAKRKAEAEQHKQGIGAKND